MGAGERPWLLRGAVIGVALVAGFVAWLATRDDDGQPTVSAGVEARIVDEAGLADLAAASGHPVYWAGPKPATELEASEDAEGNVQVRYLADGDEVGDAAAGRLAVSSYVLPDPTAALEEFAGRQGSVVRQLTSDLSVVTSTEAPNSVYFASPDNSVQVEVYDPMPTGAMSLVRSGQIRPVG